MHANAIRVALFLQVSNLDMHHLLLPIAQDLCGHIRVRWGIGHDARQVIHFVDLVRVTLFFGSRSPKGVGQGMRRIVRRGPWMIWVVLMLTDEGLRCSAISAKLGTLATGT